ncbi:dsDNA nuclease domain-containing protein [Achromobacter xylosoxidans]|uniref:dsDNA nuclease domain-containing protein n=1 Tax=Alcaligenes xylosoxydans xylosoxydans TaxID=85698 RepID=UPI0006C8B73D|nr:dsDNA nuclease domain-containing protein [Achromobacter xylosoxidans]
MLEAIAPAEDVGRDTISRFDMQYQAAAYAALEILEGNGVDCVYCDYHDDFVVRRIVDGKTTYHFFQVKTKNKMNAQWDLKEIFALKKRGQKNDNDSLKAVQSSFAGKLLMHGIIFNAECSEVTLLSNIYFHDDVVTVVDELRGKTPKSKHAKFLADNFSAIFSLEPAANDTHVADTLGKLSLRPSVGYISKERDVFASATRTAIFNYSEIDLTFHETAELSNGLVDLVYRKSRTPLKGIAPHELPARIGVGLDDLLEVLSISRSAYDALLKGSDPKALKTASVLQRWLKGAGANDDMIEYASQQKVNWDIWLRSARHIYSPLDLHALLGLIDSLYDRWAQSGQGFTFLNDLLQGLDGDTTVGKVEGLDREILFGAVCAVVVRRHSK